MFFNLHTHSHNAQENVLAVVNQYPNEVDATLPYFSVGIHPWYIDEEKNKAYLKIIEDKVQFSNCLAVGECGLDKRIELPLSKQQDIFEKQLRIAENYKKPVILHCVSAYQEVISIKKELKISVPMIIHGFSKNYQTAKSLLDHGFYLSFGKYLFRNPELSEVFARIPNDAFFLETDTIEETIFEVYQKAEHIKKINVEQQVENNFRTVFSL